MANRFGIRLFRPEEDIPPLVQLRVDIEAVDRAGNDTSEEGLRETLTWRGHDPEKDRWVVEAPGNPARLVGYAYLFKQTPERVASYIAVHPAWRRQGVASDLLDQIISRTRDLDASQIVGGARVEDSPAAIFLQDSGFRAVSKNRFMIAAADMPAAVPQWPRGYRTRTFAEVQDLAMLREAYVRSYQDIPGHGANNPEAIAIDDMTLWLREWDPQGESIILLLAPDGDLAGMCRISRLMEYGDGEEKPKFIIDAPGVVPAHRHHQLQRPLVQNAMRWIRDRGQGPVELHSYGDSEQTAGIYYDLGFRLDWQLIEYRLDLNPS